MASNGTARPFERARSLLNVRVYPRGVRRRYAYRGMLMDIADGFESREYWVVAGLQTGRWLVKDLGKMWDDIQAKTRGWRADAYERQDGRCHYGGGLLPEYWELDHVTPLSAGGRHEPDNLVAACMKCNRKKSSKTDLTGIVFEC